ncbi:MAG TPA: RNA polymerase sigma factor SigJ, partial [Rhizomicrobium sp.]|nr:RNA polymerase sigma factor SigJ [Rhizomicrobium sp.]
MNDTAVFELHRPHLLGIAYRMLGEMASAEDIVQETWLRWQRADKSEIENARAWLSTAAMRLSLDALRSARARRETYVGPWLPEPLMPDDMRVLTADTPAARAELASDLSLALLHVLERLSPEERAAFILHDAFDCEYAEIANMLGKNEPACRKLVSRARERVKTERPRYSVSKDAHHAMFARFMAAVAEASPNAFQALFADDIVFYSDGGGRVPAALNPVHGADRVARLLAGLMRKFPSQESPELAVMEINNRLSVVATIAGVIYTIITIEVEDDRVTAI